LKPSIPYSKFESYDLTSSYRHTHDKIKAIVNPSIKPTLQSTPNRPFKFYGEIWLIYYGFKAEFIPTNIPYINLVIISIEKLSYNEATTFIIPIISAIIKDNLNPNFL